LTLGEFVCQTIVYIRGVKAKESELCCVATG
jgi:hypothetical protein